MTRFFVTTGISIYDSVCWKPLDGLWLEEKKPGMPLGETIDAAKSVQNNGRRLRSELKDVSDSMAEEKAIEIVRSEFVLDCWEQKQLLISLPAELATLRVMLGPANAMKHGDRISILAGVSNRDAAWLIWGVLKHLSQSDDARLKNIQIDRPLGPYPLDPSETMEMNAGVDKLWNEVLGSEEELHLVLSGGYKALLIDLARRVALANSKSLRPYSLYYLFEGSLDLIVIEPDRILKIASGESTEY